MLRNPGNRQPSKAAVICVAIALTILVVTSAHRSQETKSRQTRYSCEQLVKRSQQFIPLLCPNQTEIKVSAQYITDPRDHNGHSEEYRGWDIFLKNSHDVTLGELLWNADTGQLEFVTQAHLIPTPEGSRKATLDTSRLTRLSWNYITCLGMTAGETGWHIVAPGRQFNWHFGIAWGTREHTVIVLMNSSTGELLNAHLMPHSSHVDSRHDRPGRLAVMQQSESTRL